MNFRTLLSSRWTTVLAAVLAVWLMVQAAGMWQRVRQVRGELSRIEDRAGELEREIARQQEQVERSTDDAWLEYQARVRLNYKLPDESVVVVYKKENSGTISPVASPSVASEMVPFWRRWWDRIRR